MRYSLGRDLGPMTGVPHPKERGTQWKYYGTEMGTPHVDRHTPVKKVPFRCTTYAGGKYMIMVCHSFWILDPPLVKFVLANS